ncbi:SURF1 family protein [Azohydromonas sp. G-1-1-14]|uniref:SURF1-like protein n=1 Tax=Azohydromonas caseinilytica TaxID=2728836 RepID=A0A848FDZ5_9BURK|nr:SURF1 family protein [Azohydromonas caseinilytica]
MLFALFLALGLWQVQRLGWKQELIARVEQRLQAAPVPAPEPAAWPTLERGTDEYRRVVARGRFAHELETLVQASTELGTGYWVLTPLLTDGGFWLLVNRGFVPLERRAREARGDEPQGVQEVSGLLRITEPKGSLLQGNDPAAGRWYSRDVAAIAAARGLGGGQRPGPVAPYFIDAAAADAASPAASRSPARAEPVEAPPPGRTASPARTAEVWPRPGLTVVRFTNNHLSYALTWFALAAMVAAATVYVLRDERRLRARVRAGAASLHGGD